MSQRSYIEDDDGHITHIVETSDDGRTSDKYEYDSSFSSQVISGGRGAHVETSVHHKDGSTDAYEPDDGLWGNIVSDGRGKHK